MKIKVLESRFHSVDEHNPDVIYEGKSLAQAIRVARRAQRWEDLNGCQCGGPIIIREDGAVLYGWKATPPFHPANKPWWEFEMMPPEEV